MTLRIDRQTPELTDLALENSLADLEAVSFPFVKHCSIEPGATIGRDFSP
jgi:hypothetical protein